jgi:7,8-dihydro-6-hydroxymethylpterin dimethyltransferase
MVQPPPVKSATKHRDYTFLGLTQSLCPACRRVVPAKIIARGKRVYFKKQCPEHGEREDFICSDKDRYDLMHTSLPAKLPRQMFAEAQAGCPLDCGLCEQHEQHTCVGVIEITDSCNLTCPMCYAGSAPGRAHKSFDEVRQAIDRLVAAEGRAEVAQLSGGEPTLHPEFERILEYALAQAIDYVMINTNGIRFAKDQAFVDRVAAHRERVEIYFQMDDVHDAALEQLRGQAGLLDKKLAALERLGQAGLNVTLVSTLQGGVNEGAPARLLELARTRPYITGLSLQPATYSGRYEVPEELEQRITYPDVIDSLAAGSQGDFLPSDFSPLPCAHPNCHWLSLAVRSGTRFLPLSRVVDAHANRDLLANGLSFTRSGSSALAAQLISRLACGGSGCCSPDADAPSLPLLLPTQTFLPQSSTSGPGALEPDCCSNAPGVHEQAIVEELLNKALAGTASARDLLRITITSFLDVYNFDVRRVMKCCTHHVLPSGHIIPFCAYNVLYRDGFVPLPPLKSLDS